MPTAGSSASLGNGWRLHWLFFPPRSDSFLPSVHFLHRRRRGGFMFLSRLGCCYSPRLYRSPSQRSGIREFGLRSQLLFGPHPCRPLSSPCLACSCLLSYAVPTRNVAEPCAAENSSGRSRLLLPAEPAAQQSRPPSAVSELGVVRRCYPLTMKRRRTSLLLIGLIYIGSYVAIRSQAVHFPLTPGSSGYSPNEYRETLILQAPVARSQQSSASFFSGAYSPLRALDRALCGSEVDFQSPALMLPDFSYPPLSALQSE